MAGTRLRGGGRSLARSGLTRNEKYNGGAAGGGEKHPPGLPSGERWRGFKRDCVPFVGFGAKP